jgi:hypothetical protein
VAVTPGADRGTVESIPARVSPRAFQTDEAASDSLWAYRNRFAQSATRMTQRMKAVSASSATVSHEEYAYLEKINDALLQASLLLTWTSDLMRMQDAMCEPGRSQYEVVVLDRLQRTHDTLTVLQPMLVTDAHQNDQQATKEILARNDDMRAAQRALDSIVGRWTAAESQ